MKILSLLWFIKTHTHTDSSRPAVLSAELKTYSFVLNTTYENTVFLSEWSIYGIVCLTGLFLLTPCTDTFKARLDKFWHNQDIVYDFRAQLQGTGSWSEVLYE